MQDKKMNVLSQILCAFQRKRNSHDDIVTAADKVIEEYIFNKNKLIRRKCQKEHKGDSLLLSIMLISAAGAVLALYMLLIY